MPHAALFVVQGPEFSSPMALIHVSMPHAALFVVQDPKKLVQPHMLGVSMPHAALFVVQGLIPPTTALVDCFNAARGFVCGARGDRSCGCTAGEGFQCRTRLCLWCKSLSVRGWKRTRWGFNAARGFVCGASRRLLSLVTLITSFNAARGFVCGASPERSSILLGFAKGVSMPHAALFVVQGEELPTTTTRYKVSMPHAALFVVQEDNYQED